MSDGTSDCNDKPCSQDSGFEIQNKMKNYMLLYYETAPSKVVFSFSLRQMTDGENYIISEVWQNWNNLPESFDGPEAQLDGIDLLSKLAKIRSVIQSSST